MGVQVNGDIRLTLVTKVTSPRLIEVHGEVLYKDELAKSALKRSGGITIVRRTYIAGIR